MAHLVSRLVSLYRSGDFGGEDQIASSPKILESFTGMLLFDVKGNDGMCIVLPKFQHLNE